VEAADDGLLARELANGIMRVKGVAFKGVPWELAHRQASASERTGRHHQQGLRDRGILAVLRVADCGAPK
jgi:hypothetical protein